jgi:hypothetical protein
MDGVIPLLVLAALIVAWNVFVHKQSGGREWSPLWMAFSTTSGAVLFLVAGAIGYTLSRHDRFVAGTGWTGGVVWWEVGVGLLLALVASLFWRKGVQQIRRASHVH